MRHNYFLGVDPGLIHDPTGFVLVRATRPAVTVRGGKVIDAVTGEAIPIPKGTTVAEFVAPRYAVTDVKSIKGLTFGQMAREARAIMVDMGGQLMAVVDATGLGRGAVDQIRTAGVPTVACTLTGGSRITGSRWERNVPVGLMFVELHSLMMQRRLSVNEAVGGPLAEELKEIERRVSDAGRETFEVSRADGHHADCAYSLALALVIAERSVGRMARAIALQPGGRQRKAGAPRQGNTAKRVIDQRLAESRARSEADLWRQIEEPEPWN